jgi:hypothetical protein
MWHFFNQAESSLAGDYPAGPEIEFLGQSATGLIEKQTDEGGHFILLLAGGSPVGAYVLGVAGAKGIPISEFESVGYSDRQRLHTVKLPDAIGRIIWLALESKPKGKLFLAGDEDWRNKVTEWQASRWTGLVEVKAGIYQGFAFLWQGEALMADAVLDTPEGFATGLSSFSQIEAASREITLYELEKASSAFQCFVLRQGAVRWSHNILSRYQELVGKNLLQVMNREINFSIQLWNWNLSLAGDTLVDRHFFPELQLATYAYKTLFAGMGTEMSFMLGKHLARRIFNEAFQSILPDETVALQAQRLIPAAFTS